VVLDMQQHISSHILLRNKGFTLLEALVAIVVVAMIASAAALAMGLSSATQEESRLMQIAAQAAGQQVAFLIETPYDNMRNFAGTEEVGTMLAPPAGGGVTRTLLLSGSFSKLGRRTTLTSEPFTFTQFNGFVVEGTRIDVEIFGPDNTVYASIRRHRTKESPL